MDFTQIAKKHLLPIIGLLLVSTIFFFPQLQNKAVQQHDIKSFKGMHQEMKDYKQRTGNTTWWTNSMFGGMPGYQIDSHQPSNLLRFIDKAGHLFIKRPIGLFFLIMLCAYVSLLFYGCDPWVSFFGAVTVGMSVSNFILFGAGHMTKLKVIGYCLPMFMGMYIAYKRHLLGGIALFGISLGLALMANHPQMLYYMGFTLIVFGIIMLVDAIRNQTMPAFAKATGGLFVVALLALGSSASKILPTLEYADDTMRGAPILKQAIEGDSKASTVDGLDWEYATNWSNGMIDVFSGLVPGVAGGSSSETAPRGSKFVSEMKKNGRRVPDDIKLPLYWGAMNSTGGAFYYGAVLLFLLFFQFAAGNRQISIWLGVSLLLLVIMSMGRNAAWFNRILFDYFPMFNKFRTPNSVSSVIAPLVAMGGAFGLHTLLTKSWDKKQITQALIYSAGPLVVITLFFAFLAGSFFDFTHSGDARYAQQGFNLDAIIADRKLLMRNDALRSLAMIVLAGGLTYLYGTNKLKKHLLIGLMTVIALFDIGGIGRRYLSLDRFETKRSSEFVQRPVDKQILAKEKNRGAYRVYDMSVNTFNDAITSYWHNTIGGYHPAKLQRFEDIKNMHLYKGNQGVLNMLNAKYIITREQKLQENPAALGNAWFVNTIEQVATNDDEINALTGFNPKTTAIVHQDFASLVDGMTPSGSGSINMTSYEPNRLVYSANTARDELAVFSEVWYGPDKGWVATIDGQPADILRVNYLLRGLRIPSGKHEIVFEFVPQSVKTGNLITLISSLLLIGIAGFVIFQYFKNRPQQAPIEAKKPAAKPEKKKKRKK